MQTEEMIALDCPNCGAALYRPLAWFKKTYGTCPACGGGVAAKQFAAALMSIELELDASVEEMLRGRSATGCCGRHQD